MRGRKRKGVRGRKKGEREKKINMWVDHVRVRESLFGERGRERERASERERNEANVQRSRHGLSSSYFFFCPRSGQEVY